MNHHHQEENISWLWVVVLILWQISLQKKRFTMVIGQLGTSIQSLTLNISEDQLKFIIILVLINFSF